MSNQLLPNQSLNPGDTLTSPNGNYSVKFQSNGKLELCNQIDGVIWSSTMRGRTPFKHAIMQRDGNLVVYNQNDEPVWASNTQGNPNAYLVLQDDRNLVIYTRENKPIWASATHLTDTLKKDDILNPGERLVSANGYYHLTLQRDGKLVLTDNQGFAIWKYEAREDPFSTQYLQLGFSGVRLHSREGTYNWITYYETEPNARLTLRNNGEFVVLGSRNRLIWSSGTAYPEKRELIIKLKDKVQIREQLTGRTSPFNPNSEADKNRPNHDTQAVISFMYEKEGSIEFVKRTRNGQQATIKITARLQRNGSIQVIRNITYPGQATQTKHVLIDKDAQVNENNLRDTRNLESNPHHTHQPVRPVVHQNDFEILYHNKLIIRRLEFFQQPFYSNQRNQGSDTAPKKVPLLPIIWEYKDVPPSNLTKEVLYDILFGEEQSIAHWVKENSLDRFKLVPVDTDPNKAIFGPIKSKYTTNYYTNENGGRDAETGRTAGEDGWENSYHASYPEAIRGAAEAGFDFSVLGDEVIIVDDIVILIIKPQAYRSGNMRGLLDAYNAPFILNGKRFSMTIAEVYTNLQNRPGELTEPIGNLQFFIEESMHVAVGITDKYPQGSSGENIRLDSDPTNPGHFSITSASGNPVHMDAYDKLKIGWLNPILVTTPGIYKIRQSNLTGDALILYNPSVKISEFFIIENRTRSNSFDQYRNYGCTRNCFDGDGIAIWHCIQDSNLVNWERFSTNLKRPQPQRYVANDNDLYPLFCGDKPDTSYELSDDSTPQNLRFRNNVRSGIVIRNISKSGFEMTLEIDFTV